MLHAPLVYASDAPSPSIRTGATVPPCSLSLDTVAPRCTAMQINGAHAAARAPRHKNAYSEDQTTSISRNNSVIPFHKSVWADLTKQISLATAFTNYYCIIIIILIILLLHRNAWLSMKKYEYFENFFLLIAMHISWWLLFSILTVRTFISSNFVYLLFELGNIQLGNWIIPNQRTADGTQSWFYPFSTICRLSFFCSTK